MDKKQAMALIHKTFENPFDKENFMIFIKNLLKTLENHTFIYNETFFPTIYREYISSLELVGKYTDGANKIDVLIVKMKKGISVEKARSLQKNFIAWYLKNSGDEKDAALVAFIAPGEDDWRFSLVKMDYKYEQTVSGKIRIKEEFTPSRRWSFLVGKNEKSHTAQSRFMPIIENDEGVPTLEDLEEAFNIETVTKEFFEKYRDIFIKLKSTLDKIVSENINIKEEFNKKDINTVDFAKKLLGQIVFVYFLQKKGWLGVRKNANWGSGPKNFLREMFEKKYCNYENFFDDILEPLFYEAFRTDRSHDDHYYSRFNCKIPFLNGGLFDPINNYDWVNVDILLPNELFSNKNKTQEGDIGDGILDVFDRYNFTVKEDEPLDKEVAVDPELLGKAYEKFNAIRPDNFEEYVKILNSGKKGNENKFNKEYGVYYTPREIVHYMCQQSLTSYLKEELKNKVEEKNIEKFVFYGETFTENETNILGINTSQEITPYQLPRDIIENAKLIDEKLVNIKICDPAVGSGAFLVGMMNEIIRLRSALNPLIKSNNRTPYIFKRECIENSLYGVDIDAGACEIAKLRLWLSLVVDEDDIKQIKPLPNLDYKIVQGNSLLSYPYKPPWASEIEKLKKEYIEETNPTKKQELKNKIDNKINSYLGNSEKSLGYKVDFDFKIVFSEVDGFDIVIANPPYVSTKGVEEDFKKKLQIVYGFSDDLYSHFYFKGLEICKDNGILCYISSKTFWTIQTKKNLRDKLLENRIIELFDTASPFDAMVDTCITIVKKEKSPDNYTIIVKDGKENLTKPDVYYVSVDTFRNAPHNVFFIPTPFNMKIYEKYARRAKELIEKWWDKISSSKNIEKYKKELYKYRKSLKPGDITLLGLITEGGQGLATSNNGKYVGVLDGTKYAETIKKSRPEKLWEAISSYKIKELNHIKSKEDAKKFLESLSEKEIRKLFDKLKEKYGRDIFGQGYLYRIISPDEIADVENLSEDEKLYGIKGDKTFVPYDKGDKEGNRWYAPTPYYIDWNKENVKFLRKNSGKKGKGMPVVRNSQFYFREGFCWSDIGMDNIKCRIKGKSVHDVKSMSLSLFDEKLTKYIVAILNSSFASYYQFNFINNTVSIQINDIRQLPVIIPTQDQLKDFELIFNKAYEVQKKKFENKISENEAEIELNKIQQELDKKVYVLYGLSQKE